MRLFQGKNDQGKNGHSKNIVIAGLGLTGLSCVDFFLAQGIIPRVTDSRTTPPGLDKLPPQVACHTGELYLPWLLDADMIIASPGLALTHPALQAASQAGVEIIGDVELFCREVQARKTPVPIVAVTGSNGKSTVTTLTGEMAKAAGVNVAVGGNLGTPALQLLRDDCELYVLELSSFQLETTHSLHAMVATVLNVSDDHMDRYPAGLAQYRAAKLRIYQQAALCVVNADDVATQPQQEADIPCVYFGLRHGDYHLFDDAGTLWLACDNKKLLDVRQMRMSGQHNYLNALAALALTDAIRLADGRRLDQEQCLQALARFGGLPHRFQLVHEHNGVRWINDSKATNVGSTLAALQGLQLSAGSVSNGRIHLLLGGDGKAADFSLLQPWLQTDNIALYCYGRDRAQLALLRSTSQQTETLHQAMLLIRQQLQPGDMVLLSPACASLDQFKNFEQRGDQFTRFAKELGS